MGQVYRMLTGTAGTIARTAAGGCLLGFMTAVSTAASLGLPSTGKDAIAQTIPSVTYPVLSAGSTGETVSRLQATLRLLGFYQGNVDGTYSDSTQAAVTQFQTAAGLPADGITGPSTWRKLLPSPSEISGTAAAEPAAEPIAATEPIFTEPAEATPAPAEPAAEAPAAPTGPPILRPNVEGSAVEQLQRELQQLGYYNGAIDGVYGEATQDAVTSFQSDQQIEVDAVVGPSTWDALTRALD